MCECVTDWRRGSYHTLIRWHHIGPERPVLDNKREGWRGTRRNDPVARLNHFRSIWLTAAELLPATATPPPANTHASLTTGIWLKGSKLELPEPKKAVSGMKQVLGPAAVCRDGFTPAASQASAGIFRCLKFWVHRSCFCREREKILIWLKMVTESVFSVVIQKQIEFSFSSYFIQGWTVIHSHQFVVRL